MINDSESEREETSRNIQETMFQVRSGNNIARTNLKYRYIISLKTNADIFHGEQNETLSFRTHSSFNEIIALAYDYRGTV